MQHLMNRDDLRKWEMERTVRMRAYDKKRTKSWSNSHYLSILLRHTLYNFHTLQVCWLFMPAVSLLLKNLWGITQNKQHKPLATGAQTSDMLLVTRGITGTCMSFSLWRLHVTCFFVHPHGFLRKRDCSQSIISLRESVLNVKGKKLNALLRFEHMNRDVYHLNVPVKWSSSNILNYLIFIYSQYTVS